MALVLGRRMGSRELRDLDASTDAIMDEARTIRKQAGVDDNERILTLCDMLELVVAQLRLEYLGGMAR